MRREARLAVHGMAISPGETAALGFAGQRPVLMLPGRLDAALAVWMVVGRRILERVSAVTLNKDSDAVETLPLARKVTSTIGLAEIVPVRRIAGQAEPLAAKYLPISALAPLARVDSGTGRQRRLFRRDGRYDKAVAVRRRT